MRATPADQQRLLALQGLDLTVARLEHQRSTIVQRGQLADVVKRGRTAVDQQASLEARRSDLDRDVKRVELDVDNVRRRMDRDRTLLDSGTISSSRQLEELQHEIGSLGRRIAELEDAQLELMEQSEELSGQVARASVEAEALQSDRVRLEGELADREAELDGELGRVREERERLATTISAELLSLYEKIGRQSDGIGAALLRGGRCEGCHLQLPPTEQQSLADAPEDEVVRCEECRRILIRTGG